MLEKREKEGITPPALRDRPQLDARQIYFYNAYQWVASSRNVSMAGALPIPIQAIEAYCNLYKIHDVEKIEVLHERISFLDGVYLDHVAEKNKKK